LGFVSKTKRNHFSLCYFNLHFRDRIRTSVNILGDGIGAGIVDHLVRNELGPIDLEEGGENPNAAISARTASELSGERHLHSRHGFNETSKL
jgi:hypothetical protein